LRRGDFAEPFERGFEAFDDFLDERFAIGEIAPLVKAFVSEPQDIEAGLTWNCNSLYWQKRDEGFA